jgi:hypothetical protein
VDLTTNIRQYGERAGDAAGMRLANGLEGGKAEQEKVGRRNGRRYCKGTTKLQSLAKGIAQLSH